MKLTIVVSTLTEASEVVPADALSYATSKCALGHVLVARSAKGVCAILMGDDSAYLEADESALIAAAHQVGVGGVIKLSVIGSDMREPISFFARNAAQAERALHRSRVPHVVLRANGFMQNVLRQRASIEAGKLVDPLGATAASHVDVHDLADVAVAVANGPFDGRALTLTGPAALTGEEMAATLSDVLGRPVRYVLPSAAQFREALTERRMPAWQIDAFIELQEAVLAGRAPHLALVTADIEAATGKPPRSFAEFARREFAHSAEP